MPAPPAQVIVCGLGRLGQHCIAILREFGVPLHGVDVRAREHLDVSDLPVLFDSFSEGDCRLPQVLTAAGVATCRTVLLVTNDERVNIAGAFAVRALNPRARIVIRSGQHNLNKLLGHHLGDFAAFDPMQLSAPAFCLAALGDETVGLFQLEGELLRVLRQPVPEGHPWIGRRLGELNTTGRRIASVRAMDASPWSRFYDWDPRSPVKAGDVVTTIQLRGGDRRHETEATDGTLEATLASETVAVGVRRAAARFWNEGTQMRRVVMVASVVLSALFAAGFVMYRLEYPYIQTRDALNVATVLILGGYDNLFGQLQLPFPIPAWLHIYSVLLTMSGTVGIGILYAFLTERVLSVRFQFQKGRRRVPKAPHVVLLGLGPLGEEIGRLLGELRRPFVAVTETNPPADTAPDIPLVVGSLEDAMSKAHLHRARSIVALGEDEVKNLEAALIARTKSPRCTVVIRTDDTHFSRNVAKLVSGARPLGVYALAAEAFAAAAFGENVHDLLHIDDRAALVTDYKVEGGDTLVGKLIGEVAYGYGVVPLLLQRDETKPVEFFPSDDVRLQQGQRLVVLASIEGLRSIELGTPRAPSCRVHVDAAGGEDGAFDGAMALARISGCDVALAQEVMRALPATLTTELYEHQAERLVRELGKVRVTATYAARSR